MLASYAAAAGARATAWFPDGPAPKLGALAASPTVGWWALACAICVVALLIVHRTHWRRFWFRAEDPRTVGLFRIVFAALLIANTNDLWEYFHFLFTDEGILPRDVARHVFASEQFRGYGDGIEAGEPVGFFDAEAWILHLRGSKQSLLWFWDSPRFFWAHLIVFELVTLAFLLGLFSRTTGFLSWGLMLSLYTRNRLFWEGTELVYFCFFFYLIFAHSGRAYSLDNWLRCRRLRRRGRLSEPGGPGGGAGVAPSPAHPEGLEPIYHLIPSWPRKLMILQLAALYCYTGAVKTGDVWSDGDALYYALNLDHFYRFYPQRLSAAFGTNLFRLMTWVTHWWETLFPLVVVGLIARWAHRERIPMRPRTMWIARGLWIALGLCSLMVAVNMYDVELESTWTLLLVWIAAMVFIAWSGWRLAHRPFQPAVPELLARHLWLRPILAPVLVLNRLRGNTDPLDLDWACRWFLGRRVWLGLGVLFHLHLAGLMNIGLFPLIMMATYIAYLEPRETDGLVRALGRLGGRWARRRPPVRIPPQDPGLPTLKRDGLALPGWCLWTGLFVITGGVLLQVPHLVQGGLAQDADFHDFVLGAVVLAATVTIVQVHGHPFRRRALACCAIVIALAGALMGLDAVAKLHEIDFVPLWITRVTLRLALLGSAGIVWWSSRRVPPVELSTIDPNTGRVREPWAHGPIARFVIGFGIIWHVTAVTIWLLPDKDSLQAFRAEARRPFATWLLMTHTDQSWGMFAPNPPRHNVFHKVLVTDAAGELWDLRTDVYAPERKPIPWIWNDRMRKMNRRMSGGETGGGDWYQKWLARWICREWALTHDGEAPVQVELIKMSYRIPSPVKVRKLGWYVPEELAAKTTRQKSLYVETCADAVMGQLSDELRQRHGLPPLSTEYKPWIKHRWRDWGRAKAGAVLEVEAGPKAGLNP